MVFHCVKLQFESWQLKLILKIRMKKDYAHDQTCHLRFHAWRFRPEEQPLSFHMPAFTEMVGL